MQGFLVGIHRWHERRAAHGEDFAGVRMPHAENLRRFAIEKGFHVPPDECARVSALVSVRFPAHAKADAVAAHLQALALIGEQVARGIGKLGQRLTAEMLFVSLLGREPTTILPTLGLDVVAIHDLREPLKPFGARVEMAIRGQFAGFHKALGPLRPLITIMVPPAPDVTGFGFREILESAKDAFYDLGAGQQSVPEFQPKFAQPQFRFGRVRDVAGEHF